MITASGAAIAVGDSIEVGGGSHHVEAIDYYTANHDVVFEAARCSPDGEVFIIQSQLP